MARFLRTVLHSNVSLAAGASPLDKDLGVNPLSFLSITIKFTNATANTVPLLTNILAVLSSVDVLFKGTSIFSASLLDLAFLLRFLWGRSFSIGWRDQVLSDIGILTLWVPFTRVPFWLKEAFPATRKGDLTLRLTPAAAFTNINSPLTIQVEMVELLDAIPEQFIKVTTKRKTFVATGNDDIDMPLGNPLVGILLFGTTVPNLASFVATLQTVKLLVDNVETDYSLTEWETLFGDGELFGEAPGRHFDLFHQENLAAAYTQNATTAVASIAQVAIMQHAYLNFDPLKDDSYLLDTAGRGRVNLQVNAGSADLARALPVELIRLPGAARAAATP